MNIDRMNAARVMMLSLGASQVDMGSWQEGYIDKEGDHNYFLDSEGDEFTVKNLAELELVEEGCGAVACFAGHLALSPEFQAAGGTVGCGGIPIFNDQSGEYAVQQYLELPKDSAGALCMMSYQFDTVLYPDHDDYEALGPEDVVAAIDVLIENGGELPIPVVLEEAEE